MAPGTFFGRDGHNFSIENWDLNAFVGLAPPSLNLFLILEIQTQTFISNENELNIDKITIIVLIALTTT